MLKRDIKKDLYICEKYKNGSTTTDLGAELGVSRQRIQQILKRNNIGWKNSGRRKKIASKRLNEQKRISNKRMSFYGVARSRWKEFYAMAENWSETPLRFFKEQKKNAKSRGISWELTLDEWWDIWQKSGKWDYRGRCVGQYVMCRKQDLGPYKVGNVEIKTCSENVKEGYEFRKNYALDKKIEKGA